MIDKHLATILPCYTVLEHIKATNSDGSPLRCRVNGKCKVWVTRPAEFRLPVKYGMYKCFYITQHNCQEWRVA